jgi:hypothetical protein
MGDVTHEQANLMLRLYELRREPRLREARDWFISQFQANTMEEVMRNYPPGSEGNVNLRMTLSYWEMAANIVNRGLIDEEFFFENTGEQWAVWEQIKNLMPAWRALFKNPELFASLEEHAKRLEAWREKRSPGTTAAIRQMLDRMRQARAQAKAASE